MLFGDAGVRRPELSDNTQDRGEGLVAKFESGTGAIISSYLSSQEESVAGFPNGGERSACPSLS